mmetsp:Transcript_8931/g.23138  ORF Transcript_8931/g.23138 Transcript_8931/m.23138 type:complete len:332 (+) Transcript_8931:455-1450(+)
MRGHDECTGRLVSAGLPGLARLAAGTATLGLRRVATSGRRRVGDHRVHRAGAWSSGGPLRRPERRRWAPPEDARRRHAKHEGDGHADESVNERRKRRHGTSHRRVHTERRWKRLARCHVCRDDILLRARARHPVLDELGGLGLLLNGYIREADVAHGCRELVRLRRAGNSASEGLGRLERLGHRSGAACLHDVRDSDAATRPQHAERICHDLLLVRREVDDAVGDYDVHRPIADWDVLDLAQPERHILRLQLARILARAGDHVGSHVHADDGARWADGTPSEERVEASARAQIDDDLARLKPCNLNWVAASEAEVRAVSELADGELILLVP